MKIPVSLLIWDLHPILVQKQNATEDKKRPEQSSMAHRGYLCNLGAPELTQTDSEPLLQREAQGQ